MGTRGRWTTPPGDPDWWPAEYGQFRALRMNGDRQAQTIGDYLVQPDWTLHPFPKESPGLEL